MAFDWSEYLSLADTWAVSSPLTDGLARSAVSRAYYAAFHRALDYAVHHLEYRRQNVPQEHEFVRNRLSERGFADQADDLDTLRLLRNRCDYDDTVRNLQTVVLVNALDLARLLVEALPVPRP